MIAVNLKSDLIYVDTVFDTIITTMSICATKDESTIQLLTQSEKVSTYLKSDVDVFLCIVQAGIDRRVIELMQWT